MPADVRCTCGATVSVSTVPVRCPECGRLVDARVPARGDESVAEVLEFLPVDPTPRSAGPAPQLSADTPGLARRMFQALLDPRAIRWMMVIGGTLSIVGLIVWLVSVGAFDSPLRQAAAFGVGTLALFAAGGSLAHWTRHRLAGEAVTFLACVVAPLNLWFYHAQELATVDGKLWIGGIVCCGLYAATLLQFRRPLFLYAFQAGVTLTVLLLLADLGEIGVTSLSLTLMILGALAVHFERAFPTAGTFDRKQFGPPLLWTGLAQVTVAVAILLPAQALVWAEIPPSATNWLIDVSRLTVSPGMATALWLAAAYVAFYVAVVPRFAGGWTILAGALCLLMAETTVLIGAEATAEGAVVALGLTSAVACIAVSRFGRTVRLPGRLARSSAVLLASLPLLLGYVLFCRGVMPSFRAFGWERPFEPMYPLAMTLLSACLAASAVSMRPWRLEAIVLRFLTAGAVLLAAAGAVRITEIPWSIGAACVAVIPLIYLIEGLWRKDDVNVGIAYTAAGLFGASAFLAVCHQGLDLFVPESGALKTLGVALVALEAAAFLLMAATRAQRRGARELSALLALPVAAATALMLWQGLGYAGAVENGMVATFALTSSAMLAASRWRSSTAVSRPAFLAGTTLLLLTTTAVDLKAVVMVVSDQLTWRHLAEIGGVLAACLLGRGLAGRWSGRALFSLAAVVTTGTGVLVVSSLVEMTAWQRLEILAVSIGTVLLVVGHVARFREPAGKPDDIVDVALWLGSLFVIVPLGVATLHHRFWTPLPSLPDELAVVTFGLLMLATGAAWRLKATTILGGSALAGYLVMLLVSLLRRPETTMGVYLAVAGMTLFLVAVTLSIYRDRLLALPEQISKREGVFQVLNWR